MAFKIGQRVRVTRCDPAPQLIGMVSVVLEGPYDFWVPGEDKKMPAQCYRIEGGSYQGHRIHFHEETLAPVDDDPPLAIEEEEEEEVCA